MPEPPLVLRVIAEAATRAEAEDEVRRMVPRVERIAPVERESIEEYWKFPDSWDVTLYLRAGGDPLATYGRLLRLTDEGWTIGEHDPEDRFRWAVWNRAPGVELLSPRVTWAQLDVWDLPEPGGPGADGT